ncbi:MAG: DUF4349 domain-containing protein, partial [Acidimicrobiales bacterium]
MRRKGTIAAAAVLLLVVAGAVVAATSGTTTRDESDVAATSAAGPAPASDYDSAAGSPGFAGDAKLAAPSRDVAGAGLTPQVGGGSTIDPAGPRIVRTADIAIEVGKGKFGGAFDRVNAIATSHGGYVTSSSTATGGDDNRGQENRARSGQLTVRVPSDRFEDVRTALGQLGSVEHQALRGEDVSGQLVDYDARLRSLQAQEDSLRVLVGKATNVGEVMQVQNTLFSVRQQIEQLQAQRAQLDQAASLATLQVSLYEPGAAFVSEPRPEPATGLADSFQRAIDGSIAVIGGIVVVIGYLVPLAVLGSLVWG